MSRSINITFDQTTVVDAADATPLVTIRKPTSEGSSITVDTVLSESSYNAIANAPVATAINSVNASLTDQAEDIAELQSQMASVSSTYPTVVTLASAMTDTSVIYLYDGSEDGYTAGDWYYYNGSAWVDGGTYGTGRISTNGRNLLLNILRRIPYIDEETDTLITALGNELATAVITGYRSITFALSNVTSSESAQSVQYGSSFTCTLSPSSGYVSVESVTVTMGGTDITSSAYSGGTVTISSVTGDVIITATSTWQTVASLTSDDLTQARTAAEYPYYASKATRVSYINFDIPAEAGYIYKFAYTTTKTTTNIGIQFFNENVLSAVANQETFSTDDCFDPGWQDNGVEYTAPNTINNVAVACIRFTFRADTGSTTIYASYFPTVTITRKAVS